MHTRKILFASLALIAGLVLAESTAAQVYPSRQVRILVGFPPGGTSDVVARFMGQWLSERLRQPFIIENRPGAATNIAMEAVTRAPADGYTLVMISSTNTVNATLYDKLSFNFVRDIAPVAAIIRVPIVLEVNPSVPARTVPDLITYAKANAGKLSLASPGNGTPAHVAGELFKMMTGIDMVHVPYRGGAPAVNDLLGGQVQALFTALPDTAAYIKAGTLRVLAVTTATHLDVLPDVPSLSEFIPGFEASYWLGLGAPKNTPAGIIDKLYNEINAALADPKMKARLTDLGVTVLALSPAGIRALIAQDIEKWGKVIRAARIKPD
jgi:tripartite-type tricarboxylate transporter receptor subunit TctC